MVSEIWISLENGPRSNVVVKGLNQTMGAWHSGNVVLAIVVGRLWFVEGSSGQSSIPTVELRHWTKKGKAVLSKKQNKTQQQLLIQREVNEN